ncbi:MucB/RseB C-terminal domain-containing protein [Halomonas salina]|uniref:MucB/RseB C-terminal domain-containing protein n=1 Tax=Halomonas salina TaxID=42565 RepID=UPI001F39A2B7|nr:MucB/RseB C-terminal domain-containing protein [Halomonas salina]
MASRRRQSVRLRAWRLVSAACMVAALAPVAQASTGIDCARLAEQDEPDSAQAWYERSLWASHCYDFRARAVRIGSDGVRTLALSHEVKDGVERERARFLDGPAVAFEREGRIARPGGLASDDARAQAAPPHTLVEHLDSLYRLQLSGADRIAGRASVRLDIEPLDDHRYGHRLWLDAATGLPLKKILLDERGRVLETFQITELHAPGLHRGGIELVSAAPPPDVPWRPGWLPEGFVSQPVAPQGERHPSPRHRIYGDGLSTLSLFVEPLEDRDLLMPGLHRLGVSHAAVLHRELGDRPRQVVAMGELPADVLRRVVESVVWVEGSEGGEMADAPDETTAEQAEQAEPDGDDAR